LKEDDYRRTVKMVIASYRWREIWVEIVPNAFDPEAMRGCHGGKPKKMICEIILSKKQKKTNKKNKFIFANSLQTKM
jgi:hypothetical protein